MGWAVLHSLSSIVNMFAQVVTGEADMEEAIKIAADELKAVYEA